MIKYSARIWRMSIRGSVDEMAVKFINLHSRPEYPITCGLRNGSTSLHSIQPIINSNIKSKITLNSLNYKYMFTISMDSKPSLILLMYSNPPHVHLRMSDMTGHQTKLRFLKNHQISLSNYAQESAIKSFP